MELLATRARDYRPPTWLAILRGLLGPTIVVLLAVVLQRYSKSLFADEYRVWDDVLLKVGVNVILAVSLNIVNGYTGQFSIGHAGFMAVGGYTAAFLSYYGSFALWGDTMPHGGFLSCVSEPAEFVGRFADTGDAWFLLVLLAAGLAAALAGVVVGLPSIRLRGDYLAIVTLGFGEIVRVLLDSTEGTLSAEEIPEHSWASRAHYLGGPMGFFGQPFYTTHFWVWLFAGVTILTAYRLKASTFGRAFLAIRENEVAAQSIGVSTTSYKVYAFVISAFFAGIAGALYAHQLGNALAPSELCYQKSFDVIIMVVIGGMGSITGSILGAVLVTALPEWLRQPTHVWHVGLAMILVALAFSRFRVSRTVVLMALLTAALELMRFLSLHYEVNLERYRMILYALSLIAFMLLRPQGFFGVYEAWDAVRFWRLRPRGKTAAVGATP
ncbi:MAG: branched-chain amino acid ABC transporter permease [Planctomycetota bacterium]|nr:branched-chain amino acid ABC transporter permease [Planctomycetota bacterium]